MSKKSVSSIITNIKNKNRFFYLEKYFNLFMNKYQIEGCDYQEENYILRRMWADGSLWAFKLKDTVGSIMKPKGLNVFTPYAISMYNIYDYPIYVNCVNVRGATFIPSKPQRVDEDGVILYAQRDKKSVYSMVSVYIDKIVNAEVAIYLNLQVQKTPWLIGTSPEEKEKVENLTSKILSDDPALFLELEEIDRAKALVSGAPYIIDKLSQYKKDVENELREYLGFNNLGTSEKKEHFIVDEVQSNNEVINASEDVFVDTINESFDRFNALYNTNELRLVVKQEVKDDEEEDLEDEEN